MFQFHNGIIKRPALAFRSNHFCSFNSTMVLLKAIGLYRANQYSTCFNSTMVLLKEPLTRSIDDRFQFQFHNGIIKSLFRAETLLLCQSFNSTMVLLKAILVYRTCDHQ